MAVLVTAVVLLVGCSGSTSSYAVPVTNDLHKTVVLIVCGTPDCRKRLDPRTLTPGQVGTVSIDIGGSYGSAILLGLDGAPVGCLPFRFSKRPSGTFGVRATQAVPCGSAGGTEAAHGKDWPDPHL